VKKFQRQAITAAGLLAVVLAPTTAMAQRNNQREVRFVAVTFHAPQGEPKLGIDAAEGVRQRMIRFFPLPPRPGNPRVVKQEEINQALTSSGYPADSAITTTDLRDLGKQMGADETMEGTIKRTAQGVEARAKAYYLNSVGAAEVLPVVVAKDAGDAGKQIAELYVKARKELPEYNNCRNALIQNNPTAAIPSANAALQQYPQGVLPRACLLTAYKQLYDKKQMPLDSVMRVATEIVTLDPDNEIALGNLVDAYQAKGDTAKAIDMSIRLYRLNPMNTNQANSIIAMLVNAGAPDKALEISSDQLKQNPGDPAVLETQWKLLQATRQWKQAIAAGEEMVKFDSTKADTTYFLRQIGIAQSDSNATQALQFLARATQKFPRNIRFLQAYASELRKQGQVQQALDVAKKVLAVDPKADQGYLTVVYLYTQLGQGDSAVAFAKRALPTADSTAKTQIGQGLLSLISPAMKQAQSDTGATADQQRENWTKVYSLSAAVDSIVPQTATAFYMSYAAYSLAANAAGRIADLAKAKNTAGACAEVKAAGDMLLLVDLNMPRGGRFNPDAAAKILQASSGLKPYVADTKTQLKCK
jgi:tetratricopeptide (TPR) repeat protein